MIAICVGHSRTGDHGAVAVDGMTTERLYNTDLADRIAAAVEAAGIEALVFCRYPAASYPAAMRWLARELTREKALVAVELHFNASHERPASGHEWLYHAGSENGRAVAKSLDASMRRHFPDALPRGVKAITTKDNGSGFVRQTPCPAVICEPFFGSNQNDWDTVAANPAKLAQAIADGLIGCYALFKKGWKP